MDNVTDAATLHPATAKLLKAFSAVKWKHTSGTLAGTVREWQAAGCPDLPKMAGNGQSSKGGTE